MARNDVYLNINALSPADAVVTGQQDMTAATVPELVLGDTPTFNFYFTDNTNVWPSWAGNASYTLTWALSDAVAGDFSPAATTGNATPITGGWSIILPLNSYDLVGLLNTKRVSQPYPVTNLWQQIRVADPSGNEITRAMFWTSVRYRAISDTQNTESASPTGGRFVTVNNVNTLTTPTAAQFYSANPVPTSALGSAANGELLIGNGTGFTKATLTAGSGVSITNGSGSITISATDGDITLDDGTAAAPSLKFTADPDTGIYRPSDNVVGISAGGVSRATFGATSAINGTTIPGSKTLVVTTDKLSALAATTSAELAGVISDETGTGALVFANTPTLVTPNIGAATGTSFNLTGSGTLGTTLTVNGTTDSTNKDTGAIVTEGGLGVEKSATIGGNLTVSGTATIGPSADIKLARGPSGAGNLAVTAATDGYCEITARGAAGNLRVFSSYTGGNFNWYWGADASAQTGSNAGSNFVLVAGSDTGSSLGTYLTVNRSTAATTLAGNFTVSGTGTSALTSSSSNLVVGSTTATSTNAVGVPQITAESDLYSSLGSIAHNNTNGNHGFLLVGKSRGTKASPTILADGDVFGELSFVAYDGAAYRTSGQIRSVIAGTPGASDLPTALDFRVAPDASATPATAMRIAPTGNLLLKSDGVDSGNGKLQLATHTDKTGGIGLGTNLSIYRSSDNSAWVDALSGNVQLVLGRAGAANLALFSDGSYVYASAVQAGMGLIFRTNGSTTALTLDSSQNATFAGKAYTASGTAATPAISFSGDTDSGFYNAGGNQVALACGGGQIWNTTVNGLSIASGKDIYLGNAYVAGAPTATGYVTIKDSAGVVYKVLVGT